MRLRLDPTFSRLRDIIFIELNVRFLLWDNAVLVCLDPGGRRHRKSRPSLSLSVVTFCGVKRLLQSILRV
jgi:hypothetical protein